MKKGVKENGGLKPLLITSNDGTQSGRSGYDVLAEYLRLEGAEVVRYRREDPKRLIDRAFRRILISGSASKSYVVSSWRLEQLAKKSIMERRPSLVHYLWGDRDWGYLHRLTSRLKIPLVLTMHACPDDLPYIFPDASMFGVVDAFILMSSHQKEFYLERGVPEEKLHVILHGIDVEHFKPSEADAPQNAGSFEILSVGQTRRNFKLLRELIQRMEGDNVVFRIISKAAFREHFVGLKNVRFESNLSNEALLRAYQESDALIMTADEATANNALLEAMSCGLPIVTEAVGGLPEYIGKSGGIVVERGSAELLREGMLNLKSDSALREITSQNARARALELRWEHSVKELMDLYKQLEVN